MQNKHNHYKSEIIKTWCPYHRVSVILIIMNRIGGWFVRLMSIRTYSSSHKHKHWLLALPLWTPSSKYTREAPSSIRLSGWKLRNDIRQLILWNRPIQIINPHFRAALTLQSFSSLHRGTWVTEKAQILLPWNPAGICAFIRFLKCHSLVLEIGTS